MLQKVNKAFMISLAVIFALLLLLFFKINFSYLPHWNNEIDLCKEKGYLGILNKGRLGNQIGQYASIYAFAKHFNMTPIISIEQKEEMSTLFPYLTMKTFTSKSCHWSDIFDNEESAFDIKIDSMSLYGMIQQSENGSGFVGFQINKDVNVLITNFPNEFRIFNQFKQELLRHEFVFHPNLERQAEKFLDMARDKYHNMTDDYTTAAIGVHVRRTDYQEYLQEKRQQGGLYLSKKFYQNAMDFFRRFYRTPLFIIASDDLDWCRENFGTGPDIAYTFNPDFNESYWHPKKASAELDMAILASCDHSVISYGTFSFWSAYLKQNGVHVLFDYWSDYGDDYTKYLNTTTSKWIRRSDPCHEIVDGKTAWKQESDCQQ